MQEFIQKNWFIIALLAVSIMVAYTSVVFLGKNNVIELEVEKVIEEETGVRIDLTP